MNLFIIIKTLLQSITSDLGGTLGLFLAGVLIITFAGIKLSWSADIIADRTGLGEAVVGAVLLGAVTSLSGLTVTLLAATQSMPQLAISISNAFGGIAIQTVFLSIADISYRKYNLEHAAASVENMTQGTLLIIMLSMVLMASVGPDIRIFHIHIVTPLLIAVYVFGIRVVHHQHNQPMWHPRRTSATLEDSPDRSSWQHNSLLRISTTFLLSAAAIIGAGFLLTESSQALIRHTGLSQSFIGALLVAAGTSIPELVTSVAAVKRGALTLAIGGIIGGNVFDTLFAGAADIAYTEGSVYHAISQDESFLITLTILLTAILIVGLLHREKRGVANIGFESAAILILYLAGMTILGTA
ncbi:MAG: sodium:calcium antiporter [Spirochaetia bacterium]|nr:sodium:calcium antiporter [Spirochaetia bacterium]